MNGRQLTEQLVVIRPELRCLFMSGCTAELVVHQGVAADQDLFIQKPFSIQTLAIKVREALNREDGAEGQTVADHA
jgi:DNA-binding response OmpR family regulator